MHNSEENFLKFDDKGKVFLLHFDFFFFIFSNSFSGFADCVYEIWRLQIIDALNKNEINVKEFSQIR